MKNKTIAHWYESGKNQELVQIDHNKFIVKTDGQVSNTNDWIGVPEAAIIWKEAAYQDEPMPTWQLHVGNVKTSTVEQIKSAYDSSNYPESWTIEECNFGGSGCHGAVLGKRIEVSDSDGEILRKTEVPA